MSEAKGIHLHDEFKLGKAAFKYDPKTVMMADFVRETIQTPVTYDLDSKRAKFPFKMWGNDQRGDCVLAGQANQTLRNERIETRRTPKITDDDVIKRYQRMTGNVDPGDQFDIGLVMLDAANDWRHGWPVKDKTYKIAAFGSVNPLNHQLLRQCIYLFNGVQLGFDLPFSAQAETRNGFWETTTGADSTPGSWGGHAVYCKRFDADSIYVITWAREVRVSNAFLDRYCDECWSVIDDLDPWRHAKTVFDVQKMIQQLRDSGVQVQT